MSSFNSDFIGDFKLGDNIVHNLEVLSLFYQAQADLEPEEGSLLRKPIIITIGSIAEAVLFDLYMRIELHTREGVANIEQKVLEEIRNKTIDEFAKYIDNARSKKLLGSDPQIYEDLHELRKLRNRIHIQNTKDHFERDDSAAFSQERQLMAEKTLESLLKVMELKYRRKEIGGYVKDFVLPW